MFVLKGYKSNKSSVLQTGNTELWAAAAANMIKIVFSPKLKDPGVRI